DRLATRQKTLTVFARQGRKQTVDGRGRLGGWHGGSPGIGETWQADTERWQRSKPEIGCRRGSAGLPEMDTSKHGVTPRDCPGGSAHNAPRVCCIRSGDPRSECQQTPAQISETGRYRFAMYASEQRAHGRSGDSSSGDSSSEK